MALDPIPNVGSQLDRAICAFLVANGCGTKDDVSPNYSTGTNTYPQTTVKVFRSDHAPENTGIEVYQVQIQFSQSAAVETGEPNPEKQRVILDTRVGTALAYMLQSDDGNTFDATAAQITAAGRALATSNDSLEAENNSDMEDFTLTHLYYKGATRGEPEDDNCAWVEIRNFECHACPSNVD